MNSKAYKLPNGKKAVFEYDTTGVGKITLECMDDLMAMVADRQQGEWIEVSTIGYECSVCHYGVQPWNNTNFCPNCGARMNSSEKPNNCETCRHKHDGTMGYCKTCGESNYEPKDEPQPELCRDCKDYAGNGMFCAKNYMVYDFSRSVCKTEPQERSE